MVASALPDVRHRVSETYPPCAATPGWSGRLVGGAVLVAALAVALPVAAEDRGLVLPGGVANPDALRADDDAVKFVKAFFEAGKPVAAICHAPWTLIEADVVRGRRMTSWPSLRTDLENAGATWVDEEVVTDGNLVTSRKPDDLPAFKAALLEVFAG